MSRVSVLRPVWRRYKPEFLERAVEHVRTGGHAAVVRENGSILMLLGTQADGRITEFGLWSILAIEQQRWRRVVSGPARGLAAAAVAPGFRESVLDWCDRDAVHRGPTRRLTLDCTACAACCHDANVVLGASDLARWKRAGRADLAGRTYVRRAEDGKVTLRFARGGECKHLQRDHRCGIYALRPFNCSVFPVGSEACLAAREDTLGLRD